MWYRSSRALEGEAGSGGIHEFQGREPALGFSQVLAQGLAADGGLFVPLWIPRLDGEALTELEDGRLTYPQFAARILRKFLSSRNDTQILDSVCESAFNFELPLVTLEKKVSILELFHGPTSAFKDFGARFLAHWWAAEGQSHGERNVLSHLSVKRSASQDGDLPHADRSGSGTESAGKLRTVLVATSGDTGGAVASAFWRMKGFRVVLLFPETGVSPRQRHQLSAWGENVLSLSVQGSFDDCQRLVKQAFSNTGLKERAGLVSANSINWGRLLPQVAYHAYAATRIKRDLGELSRIVVPSGNLGNGFAAWVAMQMGFPIQEVVLAFNANNNVPEFMSTGIWPGHGTISTLANAMDVALPSNLERFTSFGVSSINRMGLSFGSVIDDEIRATVAEAARKWNRIICPHTAVGIQMMERLRSSRSDGHWVVAATAHPSKFETIVDPIVRPVIGRSSEIPPALEEILRRNPVCKPIAAELGALEALL